MWDLEFLKLSKDQVEILLTDIFLDNKGLLDVTCKTFASVIKEQTFDLHNIQYQKWLSEDEIYLT